MAKYSKATIRFFVWRKLNLPSHENATPKFHYDIIEHYVQTPRYGFGLLQIFRGAAKTQLSMEYALYCICEDIEKYVLFVGSTQDLSNEIVNSAADLATDIDGITVTRNIDGTLELLNIKGKHAYLVSKSTGSKLRGISKSGAGSQRQRPTAIMLDDIVSDDIFLGASSLKVHRAVSWLTGALFPTLDPSSGGKVFGSGTPIKAGDPYLTLADEFGCVKIPLTDSIWPDRFSPEFIEAKKEQYKKLGQMRSWSREYDLVLTDDGSRLFDMSKIKYIDEMDIPDNLTWFMTVDGAFSEKTGADYSAITCMGLSENGLWYVYPVAGIWKPSETARQIIKYATQFHIIDIGMEGGSSFIAINEHLQEIMLDQQQYFNLIELKHGGKSKISRVSALEPIVEARRFVIIDNGDASEMLVDQMEHTDNMTIASEHDDVLDATAYLVAMDLYYDANSNHISSREELEGKSKVKLPYELRTDDDDEYGY